MQQELTQLPLGIRSSAAESTLDIAILKNSGSKQEKCSVTIPEIRN